MKWSRPFWAFVTGAVFFFAGMVGVSYFNFIATGLWGSGIYDLWFGISVYAICLGIIVICASLVLGFLYDLIVYLRSNRKKKVV